MKQINLPVVPASLLVRSKPCLIVGGGNIALAKIKHLISGEAVVTVVDPEPCDEVFKLYQSGVISLRRCLFEPDIFDEEAYTLVYAATSSSTVNEKVLEHCRLRSIFCCAVDQNWTAGDFLTPAVIKGASTTVAVSTGGGSHRRSRVIKEQLSRQLKAIEEADLLVLGTSHNELSLNRREPFHLAAERLESFAAFLLHLRGIHEFMILNTCNRVELIAVAQGSLESISLIKQWLGYNKLEENEYYCYWGWDAYSHLNTLTSGLLSQTPGENHIVAQVKQAHQAAASFGWSGLIMKQWLDTTLHVSRHLRNVSSPLLKQVELEDLCVEYLERKNSSIRQIIIIGTGMIGRGLVDRFYNLGKQILWCYHQKQPELSEDERKQITMISMENIENHLEAGEAFFCATGSAEFILKNEMRKQFSECRESWLIDLSLPRNIDPALDRGPVHVIDLDDLKHWYRREAADWDLIKYQCSKQIEEHRRDYEKIINSFACRSQEQ
ncbi:MULTISPECIES: NAD(P)-dependent oxidoreductase [unclassified Oceanispirochaeta]|uniref:NAD(P)-dependent oxidoreductase n=1 Tax=unclassified Oceanispirochaeta TaxID=2635722 RepID=UPI000E097D1B|nr:MULTISPECIES: NAD(P)-dependent oxidoreductase [unclassified Oceanispirochaeta]MBF9016945.1 hypothetical protein [Oceanispirochaeta sp. M2]NPD73308.1 hypothetical protein [Oceanispirochaeta sp. M1]RDG30970.1 hypothetical protein DV872_14505 [Oceanispirochaeta sp. M1]